MAQPSSRQGLIDYAKRQLGYPVLEINVADEQFQDLLDDAVQMYQERHYDGIERMYLKYKITEDDINRGRARGCLLYTSPSPRDVEESRMPSSA